MVLISYRKSIWVFLLVFFIRITPGYCVAKAHIDTGPLLGVVRVDHMYLAVDILSYSNFISSDLSYHEKKL